jgi:hypothetical protein
VRRRFALGQLRHRTRPSSRAGGGVNIISASSDTEIVRLASTSGDACLAALRTLAGVTSRRMSSRHFGR